MRRIVFLASLIRVSFLTGRLLAGDQPEDELAKLKREYADVLALDGVSKRKIERRVKGLFLTVHKIAAQKFLEKKLACDLVL